MYNETFLLSVKITSCITRLPIDTYKAIYTIEILLIVSINDEAACSTRKSFL